ncbi:hypothetical protein PTTG_27230 [Puccinia triticina 1-1 BBBD Race 1]|uniref:Helicase ATP-binding domain-containing protein n=1 Tax=Puccinia triticina (isolate 1-1 / race 1 (BBBD)) TaxID=630390 RepID=A0A180GM59_PUCT1|nr:hypothetical protein PTTG_27230 [Puccinia triticina 1-1 BBBD Race 1]
MSGSCCLGQFIAPISSPVPASGTRAPAHQVGFLQRGRHQVHVYGTPQTRIGDLNLTASKHLGPLLGPVSTCSSPVTSSEISPDDPDLLKLRAFVVNRQGVHPELWGCVFSRPEHIEQILGAFTAAQVKLTPIWNYNPRLFFDIPHYVLPKPELDVKAQEPRNLAFLCQCRTPLKPHQLSALEFLKKNESSKNDTTAVWLDPANSWIRSFINQAGMKIPDVAHGTKSRGSILADDMGLGKTLTSLAFISATADSAVKFFWGDWVNRCSATLVICPLATLSNWENEIRIHFEDQAIPYHVFHGPNRNQISRQDLQSALVVLTTYEMIGESGNRSHPNQLTIKSLNLSWYRIVLDEAHLMRNPTAERTLNIQELQSCFFLFLTGTPVQNRLTDLQSLITTLKIAPWDDEAIWKRCLIPRINVGAREAIISLNLLMQSICLRRTKEVLLNLPEKVEKAVVVHCSPPWDDILRQLHTRFVQEFGRLRTSGEHWDPAEFFRQLTRLRQFCNHPIFARTETSIQKWRWEDSGKIVHLIGSLQRFLKGARGIERPKAVVFSSFVGFLEIIGRALEENDIRFTSLTGDLTVRRRDENLMQFRSDSSCNILLGSIQAAGVGIDLRCAQNVYLMASSHLFLSKMDQADAMHGEIGTQLESSE